MQSIPVLCYIINTLRQRWNRRHFADDVFKYIFQNENVWISIKISLKFVPKGSINDIPVLVHIMAWRRPGDKPLFEPMMVRLLMHICVTRSQWVNQPLLIVSVSCIYSLYSPPLCLQMVWCLLANLENGLVSVGTRSSADTMLTFSYTEKYTCWEFHMMKEKINSIHADTTHWGRVIHICIGKLTIIGLDNGLSPGWRQAIIWTNAGILVIGPLGTNFSEISYIFIEENVIENVVW